MASRAKVLRRARLSLRNHDRKASGDQVMATTFQNILANAAKKGIINQYSKDSIEWFRNSMRKTVVTPTRIIREERANLVDSWTNVGIGRLYFAYYDPKHKETLPYYDTFPLMIPIHRYQDGFLALNLHYLPPVLRAKLLDSLYDTLNNAKLDENKKLKINYAILNGAAKHKYFEPCVKRYLGNHFRSRFIKVPHENWTPAVFLPVESFEKASRKEVWDKSRETMRGR